MNKIFYIAKALVLIWIAATPVSAWAGRGYIFDAVGSVSVAIGKGTPRPAVTNDAVTSGTVIRTGDDSRAVLKFEDGQVVSLQANSTFQVREYVYNPEHAEKNSIVFSMFKGGMHFITGLIGQRNPKAFRLATPNATIGIRGTEFFAVLTNDGLYNQVLSGSISVTNAAGTSLFTAGNSALTASSAAIPVSVPPVAVPAETFSQIAAIPVPPAVPAPVPPPVPAGEAAGAAGEAAAGASGGEAAGAAGGTAGATAGGAAAGGAAAATTAAVAGTGISATAIAIGVGVAAGVAALVNTTTTTHH